jgi:hypothetical protein
MMPPEVAEMVQVSLVMEALSFSEAPSIMAIVERLLFVALICASDVLKIVREFLRLTMNGRHSHSNHPKVLQKAKLRSRDWSG